jgi:hypothetical protein
VELSPTLRAQLDVLQPYLDDDGVSEILVAGPDRVFVTRRGRSERVTVALPDRQIRALADRLLRALGSRADRVEVRAGRLAEDLEVAVIGGPRGDRCPVIRVYRSAGTAGALTSLAAEGGVSPECATLLAASVRDRRAAVVVGPFGAPRVRLVIALARAWREAGRVVALDEEGGALAQADVADLVLPPDGPVEAALAAAPDVLVALDPPPRLWSGLLSASRPFVATLEAPDGRAGLERMVALALAGDARLSRSAAEALVLSGVAEVAELGPGRDLWVRRVGQPDLQQGRLHFTPDADSPPPPARPASGMGSPSAAVPASAVPGPAAPGPAAPGPAVPGPEASSARSGPKGRGDGWDGSAVPGPEASIRSVPERLASEVALGSGAGAVMPAELVEALSREIDDVVAESGSAGRPASGAAASPPPAPEPQEEMTRWAAPEQLSRRSSRALRPEDDDETDHPASRRASERMATVTGPPRPVEVARQVAKVLDELVSRPGSHLTSGDGSEISSVLEQLEPEAPASEAEPRAPWGSAEPEELTAHAVPPPELDPFETYDGSLEPGPMDSTQAAEVGEMLAGERLRPRVLDIPKMPTTAYVPEAEITRDPVEEDWDEEAPSELMPAPRLSPPAAADGEEDDGPFENEKTPVAPLFEATARRGRPRPRSAPPGLGESAASELGDPTRRRREAPEPPRGGRPRTRRDRG